MAFLVHDCPRCNARRINFVASGAHHYHSYRDSHNPRTIYNLYEVLAACGDCNRSTIFNFVQSSNESPQFNNLNWDPSIFINLKDIATLKGIISPADIKISQPPEFLPENIKTAFNEGSKCLSIGCANAAATMFRLCLDFATKQFLPEDGEPAAKIRRSLGLRMKWLFDNNKLPQGLAELAECVKDDGNDGAHEGLLNEEEAIDLQEFTFILLERIYTEKERLAEAKRRRDERHK